MTLMEVRKGNGKIVGRCDAKCYNAESHQCDCICGGRNHGVGRDRAIENTREQGKLMIDGYLREKGDGNFKGEIGVLQEAIF